ncbi:hypothetical protein IG631_07773 [Alternaria alternata]|nr:hypothetical protein IG631_07773 [Alternaria alternata]
MLRHSRDSAFIHPSTRTAVARCWSLEATMPYPQLLRACCREAGEARTREAANTAKKVGRLTI